MTDFVINELVQMLFLCKAICKLFFVFPDSSLQIISNTSIENGIGVVSQDIYSVQTVSHDSLDII